MDQSYWHERTGLQHVALLAPALLCRSPQGWEARVQGVLAAAGDIIKLWSFWDTCGT